MTIVRSEDQPIEISGVEVPCVKCGRRIAITVPRWLVTSATPQGKPPKTLPGRMELQPGFGDPGYCLPCRLKALPESATDVASEYQAILKAAAAAGIPDGAIIWPIRFAAGDTAPKRWRGFAGRLLAIQVSGLPPRLRDAAPLNSFLFELRDGRPAIEIIVYETVLGREDIPASLIFHSPPGTWPAKLEIRHWHRADHLKDLEGLMRGVEFYHALTDGRARARRAPLRSRPHRRARDCRRSGPGATAGLYNR